MKTLVIGLGIQGLKRLKTLKKFDVETVDPLNPKANYKSVYDVNLSKFNIAIVCTPEIEKLKIVQYLLNKKINVMIEKPFKIKINQLNNLNRICLKNKNIFYICYNHRFEPFIKKIHTFLEKKTIGKVYFVKMFYGNGTASQINKSKWKDKKNGVIDDLVSHLLDFCEMFFKKKDIGKFRIIKKIKFENRSPDYALIINNKNKKIITLEASYLMWKNTFHLEIIGKKGSIHMNNFCKWGRSDLIIRERKFPHGIPNEKKMVIKKKDPTWELELKFFLNLIKRKKIDLNSYKWINNQLFNF